MGIRSWLYWIDRALTGDHRPRAALAVWLAMVAAGIAAYYLTR